MKFYGYIKNSIDFSFSIPIYQDDDKFYVHDLDNNFRIKNFTEIVDVPNLIELKVKKNKYLKGFLGAVVFVARDKVFYGNPRVVLNQITVVVKNSSSSKDNILKEIDCMRESLKIEGKIPMTIPRVKATHLRRIPAKVSSHNGTHLRRRAAGRMFSYAAESPTRKSSNGATVSSKKRKKNNVLNDSINGRIRFFKIGD